MFQSFPKIARLNRNIVITEKIDGTNAQVHIAACEDLVDDNESQKYVAMSREQRLAMFAGSRNRYITPEDDNFGFAKWVRGHADELFALGEGRHYGEWYGQGIQRGYGLSEKRFALFNVGKWNKETPPPACCETVPVLYRGAFGTDVVYDVMCRLSSSGTHIYGADTHEAEGIIIYHEASRTYFKRTFEHDQTGKPE